MALGRIDLLFVIEKREEEMGGGAVLALRFLEDVEDVADTGLVLAADVVFVEGEELRPERTIGRGWWRRRSFRRGFRRRANGRNFVRRQVRSARRLLLRSRQAEARENNK